jgi:hypothetical protein
VTTYNYPYNLIPYINYCIKISFQFEINKKMCTFDSPVILLLVFKLWDLLVPTNILANQLTKTKKYCLYFIYVQYCDAKDQHAQPLMQFGF